jgi:hypothetical protein
MSRPSPVPPARQRPAEARRAAAEAARHWRARRAAVCALALAAGWTFLSGARGPGDTLAAELRAAGAAVRDLGWNRPLDHVQETVAALFAGNPIDVDVSQFPARVVVTLRALDRSTCLSTASAARRIEGSVVIELRGFASPSACGERNDMAWVILP